MFFYVWMQLRYFPEVTGTLCLLLCTDIWVSTSFCIIVSWEKFLSAVYGFLDTLKRFKTSSSQETFATHKTNMAKYKTFCFFFLSVISHQKSFTGIVNKLWWSRQLVHMGWYDEIIQIISVLPFICCFPQNIPNDSPRDASQLLMQSVACGKSKIIFVYQAKKHK